MKGSYRMAQSIQPDLKIRLSYVISLIIHHINVLPHFTNSLFGHEKTKLAFRFGQCKPEAKPSAEFEIVGSCKQHRFAGIRRVEV
jgi:hypothetical protein